VQVARKMEPAIDDYYANLASEVVARARQAAKGIEATRESLAKWGGVSLNGVTVVKALPTVEDLILQGDEEGLSRLFRTFTIELLSASWETYNLALGVDIAFAQTDPAVVAALAQSSSNIKQITETTRQAVKDLLQYGAEQGWNIDQLVRGDVDHPGLRDTVQQTYKGRARNISRTELGEAQQICSIERYRGVGVSQVLVLDNGQEDPDDACAAINGTTQTLDWARNNLLQHPSCTRAFAPAFEE